ncbi:hypothetical protein AKJ53_01525 [candidate division MSBL1 archaeon SCGC-AAA382F02]|uniref:2-phospho-L-lactate transferase n=1 Tax=candidate division MSBL1 archaeon SCGC-AAA382F02 TaxID=1698282 RepID=A0A133VHW9_9EURY|nr:hypothetical protein AKJ53_01525 [candidate division MSBL1 archaeon SCGC-AAA382F02]
MLTLISGGTGSPKLLQGLMELFPSEDLSIIVNTGEDTKVSGLRVSPDLDTVIYTLAGIIDDEKWYGIKNDSFTGHEMLEELGHEELLKIGDKDRAVKLCRTLRMQEGATLSQVTKEITNSFDIQASVLPMTNDLVTTRIVTKNRKMTFHEFWVENKGEEKVTGVNFLKAEEANPAPDLLETLNESKNILIGPSNPITSLGPILAIEEIRKNLEKNREKTLAVSPILGDSPVSGPTGVLMRGLGYEVTPTNVAELYKEFVSSFMLHEDDESMISHIEDLGMNVHLADLYMPDTSSRINLAEEILEVLGYSK